VTILVGTEEGVFSVDGGVRRTGLPGRDVTWLSDDATWALVDAERVERMDPGGAWLPVTAIPNGWPGRCLLPVGHDIFVGTAEAHLYRIAWAQIRQVEGFDAVEGRDEWHTPWGGPPDTRSLAVGSDGVLYANVHVGGIARSTDGGTTWEPTIDIGTDVHQVVTHPELDGVVVAATAFGLAVSRDAGASWETRDEGLDGRYQRAVAIAGDWAVVSSSEGHVGRRSAIWRARLDGGPFSRCAGLPEFTSNVDTRWLAARGQTVAFAGPDGSVWRSDDGGESWELAGEGLPAVRAVAVTE
jgi:photosystem II stability/assembly factor-like uncharacterized protein